MPQITGLTSVTKENLLLDAGAFFKNYDMATDTFATAVAAGKLIGATAGGGSFSVVENVRQPEVDGAKSNTKGLVFIDHVVVTMGLNVVEMTPAALKLALGSADQATHNAKYEKITGRHNVLDADYLTNITWVGKVSGSDDPMVIVVKNALSLNGLTIKVEDKKEAVVPITLTGHYDPAANDTPPYEIYCPSNTPVVRPATYTHDTGDIVLKVGGGTVSDVKNGVTSLTPTTHFTYADPVLTIKNAYLSGLTGVVPLTIVTNNGNVTFTVTT